MSGLNPAISDEIMIELAMQPPRLIKIKLTVAGKWFTSKMLAVGATWGVGVTSGDNENGKE